MKVINAVMYIALAGHILPKKHFFLVNIKGKRNLTWRKFADEGLISEMHTFNYLSFIGLISHLPVQVFDHVNKTYLKPETRVFC